MLKQSPTFNSPSPFSGHEPGVTHVLVTGGAGYIGSHATLRLLKDSYRVTIVDNLSCGNIGAVKVLQDLFPEPGRLQFFYADLGDAKAVNKIFSENAFDAVMHFVAVAYVGESTLEPLKPVKEFVEACMKATGVSIKVEYLPHRPSDYAEVFSDPSKIRRELKWSARFFDLEKSLRGAWKWQKSHHNGYEPTKASFNG
ncbi:putative UDP-arabinose 4-epimerase [Helianthus debilis subsp. tardiflorus]